ncbi:MAG TPA: ImmA/IrrE family metallo-endopeptidase [Solirubrobacteraceae bacterium]|nr:ImmA/IrrE family metallo-endopeptidase [Solirubrobacteraceae bacterium]
MSEPESRAAEVLAELPRWLWDGRSLPVPVEDVADSHFGLHVCETDDLAAIPGAPALADGEALSGLLVVDAEEIWVNAHEAAASPGRRRFTIGHELGHWVLHRTPHGRVFCRSHAVTLEPPPRPDVPDIEEEASRFAGALMFPDALVRAEWERTGGDLAALCERFGSSRVATERAVFRVVRGPEVRESAPGLACFYWDDAAYEEWRAAHPDGFVVNDDLGDPGGARLHRLSCSYLRGPVRDGRPRTSAPKWCATDPDELRRAFPRALACGRCRP